MRGVLETRIGLVREAITGGDVVENTGTGTEPLHLSACRTSVSKRWGLYQREQGQNPGPIGAVYLAESIRSAFMFGSPCM